MVSELHERDVPESDVFRGALLNQILGNLLSMRKEYQRNRDDDEAEWTLRHESASSGNVPHVAEFLKNVLLRRKSAFDETLHEIDTKLKSLADTLNITDDHKVLESELQKGAFTPNFFLTRPNFPAHVDERFGRDFFETPSALLPDPETWSWSLCGNTDINARVLISKLDGPFPTELLHSIDSCNLEATEFQLAISGLSITAHAPLIAVKLSCFFGSICVFTSESILQRPSLVPFNPAFSQSVSHLLSESQICRGDADASCSSNDTPVVVKLKFKHIASVKNRQLLFVLHHDDGQAPCAADPGIASVAVSLDSFFADQPVTIQIPVFNRTVDVNASGEIVGLRNRSSLWTCDAADPSKLALDLSVLCTVELKGILKPQSLYQQEQDLPVKSFSFPAFKQLLIDLSIPNQEVYSNESFFIELALRNASSHQQPSEVKFHIVEVSHQAYLPVLFSGPAVHICNGLYEVSALPDWTIAEELCVIVEYSNTFYPIVLLKVLKSPSVKVDVCPFICMQHPDHTSSSILIGAREQIQNGGNLQTFTPKFVHWRSQFFVLAPELLFEGRRFGFERTQQLGTWVSVMESSPNQAQLQECVNMTNGTFDSTFDNSKNVCAIHQKTRDCALTFDNNLFVVRRIFVCEDCVTLRKYRKSEYCTVDVATGGFVAARKVVEAQLPSVDPSWQLLERLRQEAFCLQDCPYDIVEELAAVQNGLDLCFKRVQSFVLDRASQPVPQPNLLQAFPASDTSLIYQCIDAMCSTEQGSSSNYRVTPDLFTGFSGVMQLGYAQYLQPANIGRVQLVKHGEIQDVLAWCIISTDSLVEDLKLYELAFDINFQVCTRGYVNPYAREAGRIFVKRKIAHDVLGNEAFSNKALSLGFEVDTNHEALRSTRRHDVSIIAWLRQAPIPDVSIVPRILKFQRPKEQVVDNFEINDHEINLVTEEVVTLISASHPESVESNDVANVCHNAACIVHSISDEDAFYRLRFHVLHMFDHPDVMMNAVQKMKELSLLNMSAADVFASLPLSKLDPVEKKVLALASRIICGQNHGKPLKITGLLNSAGVPMKFGFDASRQSDTYYCSRVLGKAAIPGSDGQCGPNDGPQCDDCKSAQQQYFAAQPSASADSTFSDNVPSYGSVNLTTMQQLQVFLGDYIRLQKKIDEKTVTCTVIHDDMCPNDSIKLSPQTCAKLRLRLGDSVNAQVCKVSVGLRVMYRSIANVALGDWVERSVADYFQKALVSDGDVFSLRSNDIDFKVQIIRCDPEGCCIVTSDTQLFHDENVVEDVVAVSSVPSVADASKQRSFPSPGDLVCLERPDGTTSTLLRKRATSSRCIVEPLCIDIKKSDLKLGINLSLFSHKFPSKRRMF